MHSVFVALLLFCIHMFILSFYDEMCSIPHSNTFNQFFRAIFSSSALLFRLHFKKMTLTISVPLCEWLCALLWLFIFCVCSREEKKWEKIGQLLHIFRHSISFQTEFCVMCFFFCRAFSRSGIGSVFRHANDGNYPDSLIKATQLIRATAQRLSLSSIIQIWILI